jgi:glycosyltransferase involved in cell wall biosynthesis
MDATGRARVILVHDWLTGMRGGEKCLELLCRRWPDAWLYTLLHRKGSVAPIIEQRRLITSFLQHLPAIERYYRYLLPTMPAAVSRWRLPACDLVFSLSHCVAKAVRPPPGVPHVCYCFTPMRYAWHQRQAYFNATRLGRLGFAAVEGLLRALRHWDRQTAERVTHFLAISRTVQRRIAECYNRPSTILYPPVDTDFYCPAATARQGYYLIVSAFAPYKRLDLAIDACQRLKRRLVVIGTGQDERRLKSLAGPRVDFLGWQPDSVIREHFRRCRALLFPGEEDFGIVPVEAQACGTPVIAFGRGGATETTIPLHIRKRGMSHEPTAVWFDEQTPHNLIEAMETFERRAAELNPSAARRQALRFHYTRFEEGLTAFLTEHLRTGILPARQAA